MGELEPFANSGFGYVFVEAREGLSVRLVLWKWGPFSLHWVMLALVDFWIRIFAYYQGLILREAEHKRERDRACGKL